MDTNSTFDEIMRWCAGSQPFPLPDYLVPTDRNPIADFPDDVIMDLPPHVITHLQRTAAQGGLQVISPRQTPMTWMMGRADTPERMLGDHVVGSIADPSNEWPTLDDADFSELLPDMPLPHYGEGTGTREKTRTEPLTMADGLLSDPILSCLVKGRAVIDVLRRPDVNGGADEVAEAIAAAWGMDVTSIMDMDAFTLAVQGSLLRHAILPDAVYPTIYAAIHYKRVISVGSTEVTRDFLPLDTAIDWRRLRVFAEAVYAMCCDIEGLPMKYMRTGPNPGDPAAPLIRPNVLGFRPMPCIAWSFAPSTFSILPSRTPKRASCTGIPKDVLAALTRYSSIVKPLSNVLDRGARPLLVTSTLVTPHVPYGETIMSAYIKAMRLIVSTPARGKTAAATVRSCIYEALEAAPIGLQARLARYIRLAKDECLTHLGMDEVPDVVIDRLANKFLEVGETIRLKIVAEAARRGYTAKEWWGDLVAQAPRRYQLLPEGTMGWARVGMWMMFRAPTDKWDRLVCALHYSALRNASKRSHGGVPLPAEIGSLPRLITAVRVSAKSISSAYASYYMGVSDVGMAVADVAQEIGKERTAETLREASYLWVLRSRCLRGTNISPIERECEMRSPNHLRIYGGPADLTLVPCPYVAFTAYRSHCEKSQIIHSSFKRHLSMADLSKIKVSQVFTGWPNVLAPCRESTVTRYLRDPRRLGLDMEKGWREMVQDLQAIANEMKDEADEALGNKTKKMKKSKSKQAVNVVVEPPLKPHIVDVDKKGYFEMLSQLTPDEVDGIEDEISKMPPEMQDMVYDMEFVDAADMIAQVFKVKDDWVKMSGGEGDTVM